MKGVDVDDPEERKLYEAVKTKSVAYVEPILGPGWLQILGDRPYCRQKFWFAPKLLTAHTNSTNLKETLLETEWEIKQKNL